MIMATFNQRYSISAEYWNLELPAKISRNPQLQAFLPIVSWPLFGLIYRSTVQSLPQAYLIVVAGLFFLDLCILAFVDRGLRRVDQKNVAVEMADFKKTEDEEQKNCFLDKEGRDKDNTI